MPSDPPLPLLDGPPQSRLPAGVRAALVERLHAFIGRGRVRHVEGVGDSAAELAQRFAPELTRRAEVAGLLHDHAKKQTDAQLIELAARFDIEPTPVERAEPQLLHGKVGAALLPERFGLADPQVAQAVRDHVVGDPAMGALSQLLYVADQIEPGRDFPGVAELRELARRDLRASVALVARHKIEHALGRAQRLEPLTAEVWNAFHLPAVDGQE